MVEQNKGKDLKNIAKSKLVNGPYYMSKKYDGFYVQVKYTAPNKVEMWTSGGKPFYLAGLADFIMNRALFSFHIECEYNYNCDGFLGDRGKSAIMTTYRTNYAKDIYTPGDPEKDIFRVLDAVDSPHSFETRLQLVNKVFGWANGWFKVPVQHYVATLEEAEEITQKWVKQGYEGSMLKAPSHKYQPGKRTNDIIKLKPRLTADLICLDIKDGTGKYENSIGALLLQDSAGRRVWVGSGLSDADRGHGYSFWVGKVIEIEYERIDDTYIQPIIKCVREDKTIADIS